MSAPSMTSTSARSRMNTKVMVSMAMLTGIAYIVMLASKLMPSVMFLDFDFKDVIICIGGFTFGPMAAAIISILVAFIEMITISTTPSAVARPKPDGVPRYTFRTISITGNSMTCPVPPMLL